MPRITPCPSSRGARDRRRMRSDRRSPAAAGSSAFASPKSSTLTVPSGRDLDVGGLQVAVDDAVLVRRLERLGDLPRDRQCLVDGNGPRAMRSRQRRPFDQLHDERRHAVASLQAVNLAMFGMVQRRQRPAASRWKRASRSGSFATRSGRTLMATSRSSLRVPWHDTPRPCRLTNRRLDFGRAKSSAEL